MGGPGSVARFTQVSGWHGVSVPTASCGLEVPKETRFGFTARMYGGGMVRMNVRRELQE